MTRLLLAAELAAGWRGTEGGDLIVIPGARRGRRGPEAPAAAARALREAPAGAIAILAPEDESDDDRCAALADLLGVAWVRLCQTPSAGNGFLAAWLDGRRVIGRRELEVLAGLSPDGRARAGRPAVLARWAAAAWRPCRWCPAGGAAAARCGRCGARVGES